MRILLIEDDYDDQEFFADTIEQMGLKLQLFLMDDCFGALDLINRGEEFDIVFINSEMPKLGGLGCLKAIKAYNNSIPVIIMSDTISPQEIDDLFLNGAHFYVVKPTEFSHMVEILQLIFNINWKAVTPKPTKEKFVIHFSKN